MTGVIIEIDLTAFVLNVVDIGLEPRTYEEAINYDDLKMLRESM